MKKIALVNCYFGKFPWFFSLFLKSCEYNPTIDFFIFTDNISQNQVSENVNLIPYTLEDFNKTATKKLGFTIDIKKPYKLCDFKPAYGEIFSEYLEDYDFWGITDIDVIYGRIREFMTDELLDSYDTICVRHDFITACCMLFRNNSYVNSLYKRSKDYRMIFTSEKNYCFDEANFEQAAIQDKYDIFSIDCEIVSMQHIILTEERKGNLRCHFDFIICEGTPGSLKWDKGVFSYENQFEIMLYHLLNYKGNIFANKKMIWEKVPDVFYIDKFNYRESNSFSSKIKTFYRDKVKYFLWYKGKAIDMFISTKIIKRSFFDLQEGKYYYYLNKQPFTVEKNENGENHMVFRSDTKYQVFDMFFSKKCFCVEGLPFIFVLEDKIEGKYQKFNYIGNEGYANVYNKFDNQYQH